MKGFIVCLVVVIVSASRCSDEHICEGIASCCKGTDGKWACCGYASGVCCPGSDNCCPPMYTCSTDGEQCTYDPFGFLAQIDYSDALGPAKENRYEDFNS